MGKVREHDTGGRRREDRRRATTEQKNEGGRDRMADIEGREKKQGKVRKLEWLQVKKMARRFNFESRIHDPAKSM